MLAARFNALGVSAVLRFGLVAAAAIGCGVIGPPIATAAPDPSQVEAVERAFAADAADRGVTAAFKRYAAPEAIILQPDPVNAQAHFAGKPETKGPPLVWWPIFAGIAVSGDLAFTTGPYSFADRAFGYYFTVWRRQPDGGWKWIFDAGPDLAQPSQLGPRTATAYLPIADRGPGSTRRALVVIRSLETDLAKRATVNAAEALRAVLADDALVMGSTVEPKRGLDGAASEFGRRPAKLTLSSLGEQASAAGDLVWTYGDVHWDEDGRPRRGHYARIWQWRGGRFRLAVDELLALTAAP